ncbi:hypothetical protein [Salinadaptatus halalkaliphilus]|uniref:hypothetical protein n=1 Tax=Salinadaptatus halalkaliphilus TaxID=2419781 RepID=UPI001580F1E9
MASSGRESYYSDANKGTSPAYRPVQSVRLCAVHPESRRVTGLAVGDRRKSCVVDGAESYVLEDWSVRQEMWAIDIPTVDMFDRPRKEIVFYDYRLDLETLTGRKSVPK